MNCYSELLRTFKIPPNFYISDEYFEAAEWFIIKDKDSVWVEDSDGVCVLPEITMKGKVNPSRKYLAGFPWMNEGHMFDFQFIYTPIDFLHLSGSQWRTVRKNLNRTEKEIGESLLMEVVDRPDPERFLQRWEADENFHDPETFVKYVFRNRAVSFYGQKSGKIYGLAYWDENHVFINFRYLIHEDIPGLSDSLRVYFMRFVWDVLKSGKMVNDGGSLDRESLYWYKKRLNPLAILEIRSTL
jgi:hypothetical protein